MSRLVCPSAIRLGHLFGVAALAVHEGNGLLRRRQPLLFGDVAARLQSRGRGLFVAGSRPHARGRINELVIDGRARRSRGRTRAPWDYDPKGIREAKIVIWPLFLLAPSSCGGGGKEKEEQNNTSPCIDWAGPTPHEATRRHAQSRCHENDLDTKGCNCVTSGRRPHAAAFCLAR